MQGLNLRHPTCKEGALPAELIWQRIAGDGLEPTTQGVWTPWAIQLLYPAVPDARIELTASWSQTRRSPNWANPVYAEENLPQYCRWRICKKSECCHHTLWPCRSNDPTVAWTRKSPDRQSGGISNYPMRPLYIPACASSIYPQIYTRTLFAIKRKPNG